MDKLNGIVTVDNYIYTKQILDKTLTVYKLIDLYLKICPNIMINSHLMKLKKNMIEQFNQMLSILEIQDEN